MRCPNCNRRIDKDTVFCPMCGTQLTRNEKKQRKQPIWIAAAIILLAVILVVGWFLGTLFAKDFTGMRMDDILGTLHDKISAAIEANERYILDFLSENTEDDVVSTSNSDEDEVASTSGPDEDEVASTSDPDEDGVISTPSEDPSATVANNADILVIDAYSDYIAKNVYGGESYFYIPKVHADLPEIDKTNAQIYDDYYGFMQTYVYEPIEEGVNTAIEEISYIWEVKDQYLSILMLTMWGGEPMCGVYTVSLETGALVDNNELLSAYEITLDEFNALVEQAAKKLGDNLCLPVPYVNPGSADLCAVGSSEEWGISILVNLTGSVDPVYPWEHSRAEREAAAHETIQGTIPIQAGYYVQDGNEFNTLTVHSVSNDSITFSAWWYRIWDIFEATATGNGNTVSFDYTKHSASASGSIAFSEDSAVLTLTNCDAPYLDTGDYHFTLIGRVFTDAQLAEISAALGVPPTLDVEFKQGEPAFWEGGGFYRTNVEILHNGEIVAGASVDSLTGSLAGNIYTYSG